MGVLLSILVISVIYLASRYYPMDVQGDDDERYLVYLPYQGTANQLNCLIRATHIAAVTRRTLLVPPLLPSKHNSDKQERVQIGNVFDLEHFFHSFNVRYKEIIDDLPIFVPDCITFGRWRTLDALGEPGREYAVRHGIDDLTWLSWPHPPPYSLLLQQIQSKKVACIANLQHIHFPNLDHVIQQLEFRPVIDPHERYERAVHWRRGDFRTACRNKNHSSCLPDPYILSRYDNTTSLIILSDDPTDLPDHYKRHHRRSEGIHGLLSDMRVMIAARRFTGNRYSTVSRLVRVWRSLHGRSTDFF